MLQVGTRVKVFEGEHAGVFGKIVGVGIVTVEGGAYATITIEDEKSGEMVTIRGGQARAVLPK